MNPHHIQITKSKRESTRGQHLVALIIPWSSGHHFILWFVSGEKESFCALVLRNVKYFYVELYPKRSENRVCVFITHGILYFLWKVAICPFVLLCKPLSIKGGGQPNMLRLCTSPKFTHFTTLSARNHFMEKKRTFFSNNPKSIFFSNCCLLTIEFTMKFL